MQYPLLMHKCEHISAIHVSLWVMHATHIVQFVFEWHNVTEINTSLTSSQSYVNGTAIALVWERVCGGCNNKTKLLVILSGYFGTCLWFIFGEIVSKISLLRYTSINIYHTMCSCCFDLHM